MSVFYSELPEMLISVSWRRVPVAANNRTVEQILVEG